MFNRTLLPFIRPRQQKASLSASWITLTTFEKYFFCLRFVVFIFFVALRLIFAFNVTYTREKILLRVLFNAFNKFYVTFSLFFFGDSFRLLLAQHLVSEFTQDTKNDELGRRRRKTKRRTDSRGTLGDFYLGSSFQSVIFRRDSSNQWVK